MVTRCTSRTSTETWNAPSVLACPYYIHTSYSHWMSMYSNLSSRNSPRPVMHILQSLLVVWLQQTSLHHLWLKHGQIQVNILSGFQLIREPKVIGPSKILSQPKSSTEPPESCTSEQHSFFIYMSVDFKEDMIPAMWHGSRWTTLSLCHP
jgi:hypothetical protein